PFVQAERKKLKRLCKGSRLTFGEPDQPATVPQVATDDRPFLAAPSRRPGAMVRALSDALPRKDRTAIELEGEAELTKLIPQAPRSRFELLAAWAAALALALTLASLLVGPQKDDERASSPTPVRSLGLAMALFAAGGGGASLVIFDGLLRYAGVDGAAWMLIVPSAGIGLGVARLWFDVRADRGAKAAVGGVLGATLAVVASLSLLSSAAFLPGWGLSARLALVALVAFGSGAAFGYPLGACHAWLALQRASAAGWLWSAGTLGWGFGAATGAMFVRYIGIQHTGMLSGTLMVGASIVFGLRAWRTRATRP
ncbi:MAG: hypothetical protein AAGA56_21540, partial [Myxococcota bacterium]